MKKSLIRSILCLGILISVNLTAEISVAQETDFSGQNPSVEELIQATRASQSKQADLKI